MRGVFRTARAPLSRGPALAGGAPLARQRDIAEERSDPPTEAQIKDLVACLVHPDSPVNRD